MKIYFLSSTPCALTIGGAYFGITDRFQRFADIPLKNRVFVEFTPENAHPIGFFLTENIRFSPPDRCEVYLLKDGIAIYARDFPPRDVSLRILTQKRNGNVLVTLFQQGEVQASVQSEKNFFVATLPPSFADCEIDFRGNLVFFQARGALAVFHLSGEKLLLENTLSATLGETELSALLPLSDSLGRAADCAWTIGEDTLTRTKFSLSQARARDGSCDREKIRDELLPYAFLESVLIGGNFADLLSDELAPKADKIKAFLGDFVAVTITENPNVCALIRKKGERLFEAAYFSVETENGKITDIKTE